MTISIEEAVAQALAAHERGDLETAKRAYEDIIAFDDQCSDAWHLLGVLHHQTGQSAIAVELILKALGLLQQSPDDESRPGKLSRYYNNLGLAYLELGEKVEAERCFRIALSYNRGHSSMWYNLANLIHQSGFYEEAAEAWQEVIRLEGDCTESGNYWNNLGNCFLSQGENDQALACFDKADSLSPLESNFLSNRLMTSLYDPKLDAATLQQWHDEWERRYGSPTHDTTRLQSEPSRKIRIGYVSADFKLHAINSFFGGFFEAHDREKFEFYLYAEVRNEDEISRRLATQATAWCNTTLLDDAAMADRIRADRIDILVDLAGHTAGNSLRVFAMRPAPIQLSYLGYPHATV